MGEFESGRLSVRGEDFTFSEPNDVISRAFGVNGLPPEAEVQDRIAAFQADMPVFGLSTVCEDGTLTTHEDPFRAAPEYRDLL